MFYRCATIKNKQKKLWTPYCTTILYNCNFSPCELRYCNIYRRVPHYHPWAFNHSLLKFGWWALAWLGPRKLHMARRLIAHVLIVQWCVHTAAYTASPWRWSKTTIVVKEMWRSGLLRFLDIFCDVPPCYSGITA